MPLPEKASTMEETTGKLSLTNRPPTSAPKMRSWKAIIVLTTIGVIAVIAGIVVGCLWTSLVNGILLRQLVLSPSSTSFSMWKETPIPMYLKLYLFNWTNPDDFTAASAVKPNFVEMGPYVFKEVDYKVNTVWNDNGTVTFRQRRLWHFVESMSVGSLSDTVTNLNPIVATVGYMMRFEGRVVKMAINSAIKLTKEKITVTKTVNQLLFEGYKDKILAIAHMFNMTGLPFDKFGWFYGRNNSDSYDGTFNMLVGDKSISDLGTIREWNYSNRSKFYKDSCASINGTLGDLWPPLKDRETVSVFAPDVCTSLDLTYSDATEYVGLAGSKYVSGRYMLDNGTDETSRACYCKDVECQPSGTLNVSLCKFGAPAFVSLPHFYLADESYRSAISGMKPRKEDHEFAIVVEPNTGIPMQVRAKLQLNLLVQPDAKIQILQNIPKTYIPMLWFKQEANLTESLASQAKFVLVLPTLGHVTFFGIAGIGFLLLFIGCALYVHRRRQADDARSLIPKAEDHRVNGNHG